MRNIQAGAIALAAVFFLAACGGGGGGDTPAPEDAGGQTVSSTNARTVAGLVADAGDVLMELADTAGGLLEEAEGYVEATAGAGRAAAAPADVSGLICPGGGAATVDLSDTDPQGVLSAGDSLTVAFTDCKTGEDGTSAAFSGSVDMAVQAATGDYGAAGSSFTVAFTFRSLSIADSTAEWTVEGGFTLVSEVLDDGTSTATIRGDSLTVSETDGSSVTYADFVCTATADPGADAYTLDLDGTVSGGEVEGDLVVETSVPFSWTDDNDPTSGKFTATADDGSSLTLEAHPDGTVTITVDEDGDGSADATIETTWDEIGS